MKTKIKTLPGAILSLLVAFGFTHSAAAQDARIVYSASVTDHKTHQTSQQIFSMDENGNNVVQLSSLGGAFPAWSSDQRYVLFHHATYTENTLYVMEAVGERNGGRIFPVVQAYGTGADWAPDDSAIVFEGTADVGYGLWIVALNADTGEVGTPALLRAGNCYAPSWSPDGTKIAFTTPGGQATKIVVLNLGTSAEFSIDARPFGEPSWSPTGDRLAFNGVGAVTTTKGHKTTTTWHEEIFVANADGSGITQVTAIETNNYFPTWSPDGTQLAFWNQVNDSNSPNSIYKLTLATGALTFLRSGTTLNWAP